MTKNKHKNWYNTFAQLPLREPVLDQHGGRTMPGKQLDVVALKAQVETAMEVLLRAADARVQWKPPKVSAEPPDSRQTLYSFLPGVYRSVEPQYHEVHTSPASDHGAVTLLLHGDSTFEYTWEMHRPIPRAMEYRVELVGVWSKPVLNRSRRGDDDQRVFLTAKRIRFQRLSNYGMGLAASETTGSSLMSF
jgi:hypothetical protein